VNCDHTVGYMHEFIVLSELSEKIKSEAYGWNKHAKTMAALGSKGYKDDYNPIDFLDGRRGYMTMFKHCPYCGYKINWKEIKKSI